MSAGTAARESIALIQAAGATPHAVAIALDRQKKGPENGADVPYSAVQYVRQQLGLQVCAIAQLSDLLEFLEGDGQTQGNTCTGHGLSTTLRGLTDSQHMPVRQKLHRQVLSCCLAAAGLWHGLVVAQSGGIYVCVDAKGRKLTSDRPIPECIDREQRELGPSGSVRRTIAPTLTAQERSLLEAQQRQLQDEANKLQETKAPRQSSDGAIPQP